MIPPDWPSSDAPQKGQETNGRLPKECDPDCARAFFFGASESQEFHGLEILRASSRASDSGEARLTSHPNYLEFHFRDTGRFPNLDELMVWVYHRVIRKHQGAALQDHLRRIAALLRGRPCPETQLERLRSRFDKLCKQEEEQAREWGDDPKARLSFQSSTSWTFHFYAGLLREWTFLEAVQQQNAPTAFYPDSHQRWYYPGADCPEWTAWTVVVEVAIRRLVAAACEAKARSWLTIPSHIQASTDHRPSVLFSVTKADPALYRLNIFSTQDRARRRSKIRSVGAFRCNHAWVLTGAGLPWPTEPLSGCPSAIDIWEWASLRSWPQHDRAREFLGLN